MRKLSNCGQIEVRESPIEGFGVFAKSDISAGTILEEVPVVLFPRYVNIAKGIYDVLRTNNWVCDKELYMENLRENMGFKAPERYYFKWHPPVQIDNDAMYTVLPLGFGPCYNTSNTDNNADWKMLRDTFVFKAEKDIKKDEEVRTFYGYFLGEDGSIFDCESVFHLAIDMFVTTKGNVHKIKVMRFGNLGSFHTQRNNPAAIKMNALIQKSVDGLTIKKLALMNSAGTTIFAMEVPENTLLSALYGKLRDMSANAAPLAQFTLEYTDKETQKIVTDNIVWKK